MESNKDLQLAVLIDADNIPSRYIKTLLEEIAKYGIPSFKRIYGDWTRPQLAHWKNVLLEFAITPIQQYSYTTGKNSTDSAMIIDAMDILYTRRVDGFCLVTSDSDFTRLATRLREAGMKVFGMGEKKTPSAFRVACDKFIYLEILEQEEPPKKGKSKSSSSKKGKEDALASPLTHLVQSSINDLADESGWVYLSDLGNLLIKKQPDFDPRNYGFKKLLLLIKSLPKVEIEERDNKQRNSKDIFVRWK